VLFELVSVPEHLVPCRTGYVHRCLRFCAPHSTSFCFAWLLACVLFYRRDFRELRCGRHVSRRSSLHSWVLFEFPRLLYLPVSAVSTLALIFFLFDFFHCSAFCRKGRLRSVGFIPLPALNPPALPSFSSFPSLLLSNNPRFPPSICVYLPSWVDVRFPELFFLGRTYEACISS